MVFEMTIMNVINNNDIQILDVVAFNNMAGNSHEQPCCDIKITIAGQSELIMVLYEHIMLLSGKSICSRVDDEIPRVAAAALLLGGLTILVVWSCKGQAGL